MNGKRAYVLAVSLLAVAVVTPEARSSDYEVTPFAGFTAGGRFTDESTDATLRLDESMNVGIMLDVKDVDESWYEFYYSRQRTQLQGSQNSSIGSPPFDVNIEYFHLGGTYGTRIENIRPYIVGTIGATYMNPDDSALESETKFSFSLGGGIKTVMTDRIGIRLEARWFGTLIGGNGAVFCSGGSCLVHVQGDLMSQVAANAGVVVGF
jgi:opacity protein-like surface antigen